MAVIQVSACRCERCNHEWVPKRNTMELPKVCPKCKNPYWNVPKRDRTKAAA